MNQSDMPPGMLQLKNWKYSKLVTCTPANADTLEDQHGRREKPSHAARGRNGHGFKIVASSHLRIVGTEVATKDWQLTTANNNFKK
ncbi:hypothetical protein ACTXT7_015555 [Hymenolepis weldensis]